MRSLMCIFLAAAGFLGVSAHKVRADVDIMMLSAHPDDEGIFGGGVLPYYAQVLDLKVLQVTMTTYFEPSHGETRTKEIKRAVSIYAGQPIPANVNGRDTEVFQAGNITLEFGRFKDAGTSGRLTDPGGREQAAERVATLIRKYKPKVVVASHNLSGDYGHGDHRGTAIAAIEGYDMAADASVSLEGLPAYRAEKVYVRGTLEENSHDTTIGPGIHQHFHDFFEDGAMDGVSARIANDLGVKQHVTQYYLEPQAATHYCTPSPKTNPKRDTTHFEIRRTHESEDWTLFRSTVSTQTPTQQRVLGRAFTATRGDFLHGTSVSVPGQKKRPHVPDIIGGNVGVIGLENGSYERITCNMWRKFDHRMQATGKIYYHEYPGGDFSADRHIVLRSDDGERIRANLETGVIERQAPGATAYVFAENMPRDINQQLVLDRRVNGRFVSFAAYEGGHFEKTADKVWTEFADHGGRFTFRELGRDQWSVYLRDDDRGIDLFIDMHRRKIGWSDNGGPRLDRYTVISAR